MKCDHLMSEGTCNNEHADPSGLCYTHRNMPGETLRQLRNSAEDRQAIIDDVFRTLVNVQSALVHDEAWEERGRRALALVTERLTRRAAGVSGVGGRGDARS